MLTGISCLLLLYAGKSIAQDNGHLSGNFQADVQTSKADPLIGAAAVPEKMLFQAFSNILYNKGNFSAGLRYEAYLPPLLGFDPQYKGSGIPYRFAQYNLNGLDITVGNYYDQFGNGLVFRSFEEKALGLDNAMDGVRLKYSPTNGVYLKTIYGRQRVFFALSQGIVRGADAEVTLNDAIPALQNLKPLITLGASIVSRFQSNEDPVLNLPENVAAGAGRANISYQGLSLNTEFAYKVNDPSYTNLSTFKPGKAFLLNASYSQKGYGVLGGIKYLENMSFKSDRNQSGNNANINYLPPISKQHTWLLITLYPYATQPNGEMGAMLEGFYTFKPESALGGKYGTNVSVNFSRVTQLNIDSAAITNKDYGYQAQFLSFGKREIYRDFNIEITKKLSPKWKSTFSYINLLYDRDAVQGLAGYGKFNVNFFVLELQYKINKTKTIRTELQSMLVEDNKDKGSWALALAEYTIAPHWFVALIDQYNYGNPHVAERAHYYSATAGYINKGNRFQLGYGRQRAGLLCIGGICRNVPASNGFTFTVTSSF